MEAAAPPCACLAAFLHWLQQCGVAHKKCGIGTFPGTGRGAVALQPISCGDVVVAVPDNVPLLPDNCCIADVRPHLARYTNGSEPYFFC
jgi:hypothetical protein